MKDLLFTRCTQDILFWYFPCPLLVIFADTSRYTEGVIILLMVLSLTLFWGYLNKLPSVVIFSDTKLCKRQDALNNSHFRLRLEIACLKLNLHVECKSLRLNWHIKLVQLYTIREKCGCCYKEPFLCCSIYCCSFVWKYITYLQHIRLFVN